MSDPYTHPNENLAKRLRLMQAEKEIAALKSKLAAAESACREAAVELEGERFSAKGAAVICAEVASKLRAVLAGEGETRDPLAAARLVVEAQAKDYGLWFVAQYATEAYLQAALRRLHAAIEGERLVGEGEAKLRETWRGRPIITLEESKNMPCPFPPEPEWEAESKKEHGCPACGETEPHEHEVEGDPP